MIAAVSYKEHRSVRLWASHRDTKRAKYSVELSHQGLLIFVAILCGPLKVLAKNRLQTFHAFLSKQLRHLAQFSDRFSVRSGCCSTYPLS